MNKTAPPELYRVFLLEGLPEPLTPASSHVQIFDNYIEGTRIRLRHIRDPYSNTWTRLLQQRIPPVKEEFGIARLSEMHLSDAEYEVFRIFEGREIRKNRYFHEFDQAPFMFDVYLGALRGLTMARVNFADNKKSENFESSPFAVVEVTNDTFFAGENLVGKRFSDVQAKVAGADMADLHFRPMQDE